MTNGTSQSMPPSPDLPGQAYVEELDPANQSLADALRKSFRILKLLMFVLLILYFLSGWFSVKPNEVGIVLRYGKVVGAGDGRGFRDPVLTPGWHWSWPYPFEQWITVPGPQQERKVDLEFMFQRSDEEKTSGIKGYKYDNLSPLRDDYLITGDVNIIHAHLSVRYRITDPVAYVTYVYPMPDREAGLRAAAFRHYPEYTLLVNLIRGAVIEAAARRPALKIRGEEQNAFLVAVGLRVNEKLAALARAGAPLGIEVDAHTGIIAPKIEGVEAIMPPRQTQEVFDQVQAAGSQKSGAITKAHAEAQEELITTAGPEYARIAAAIEREFDVMLALSRAESAAATENPTEEIGRLRAELAQRRSDSQNLLTTVATGIVRAVLQDAEIERDAIIQDAAGDYEQFKAVLPEYLANPAIFFSRRLDETYAMALNSQNVAKLYVPRTCKEVRLSIPRGGQPVFGTDAEDSGRTSDRALRGISAR